LHLLGALLRDRWGWLVDCLPILMALVLPFIDIPQIFGNSQIFAYHVASFEKGIDGEAI
jgi:hypothetical protein